MPRLGLGNSRVAKQLSNEPINRWVNLLLVRLAREGHKPGQRWGRGFYTDFYEYLAKVADFTGRSPLDLAVRLAITELTRVEVYDDPEEEYSWIDSVMAAPEVTRSEEDYSWVDAVMAKV